MTYFICFVLTVGPDIMWAFTGPLVLWFSFSAAQLAFFAKKFKQSMDAFTQEKNLQTGILR